MKKLILLFAIAIPVSVAAVDKVIIEGNNHYYSILERLEIIKNKSLSKTQRQQEFTNYANEFGEPGANWQTLKIGVLEIIAADADFWSQEIINYPAMQDKLITEFSLDWYHDDSSNYPEKQALAIKELTRKLEKIEKEKAMLEEMRSKLKAVKPTSLD